MLKFDKQQKDCGVKSEDRRPRIRPKSKENRSNCGFCTCRACPENALFLAKADEILEVAKAGDVESAEAICYRFLSDSEKYRKNDVFFHNFHLKLLKNCQFLGPVVRSIVIGDLPEWAHFHESFKKSLWNLS